MNNNISIHARSFTAAFSTEALACPPGTRWHHVLLLCQQLFESVTVDMHVHKVTRESAQRHLLTFQRQFCPTTLVHLPETVLPNDTRSPSRDSVVIYIIVFRRNLLCPSRKNSGSLTWVRKSSRRSRAYTHSCHACSISVCPNSGTAGSVWGLLTCGQTLVRAIARGGLYGHRKRVCTESGLLDCNPLPPRGLEPASALRRAFQSDALPTEPSLYPFLSPMCSLADRFSLTRQTSVNWFLSSEA